MKDAINCPHCGRTIELELSLLVTTPAAKLLLHPKDLDPGWTARVENVFLANDITTVRQLTQMCEMDLLRLPNFGRSSLAEVKKVLAYNELRLGMEHD